MNGIDVFEAFAEIDDRFINEADPGKKASVPKHKYVKILAAAAALVFVLSALFAYDLIINDYDYLVSKSDIGNDHIPDYSERIYEGIAEAFCALDKKPSVLSVETLCRDDSKFLCEFIVTGGVKERIVDGETHYFLPVIFDEPVFCGSKVDVNLRFVRMANADYIYNRFSRLENMPEGSRFLAFVSDVDDSNVPVLGQNMFYIDSDERLVPMLLPVVYHLNASGKPTIRAYNGFLVEDFKKIALAFYNNEQEQRK